MNRPFEVGTGTVAGVLVPTVVIPLLLGLVVQAVLPNVARRVAGPMIAAANILLLVALALLLALVLGSVFEAFTARALVAMVVFVAAGLGVGHAMAGPEPGDSVVLAIACVKRNPGIAIAIATENFPEEAFAPTVIMYALVVAALTTPYVRWMRRASPTTVAAA